MKDKKVWDFSQCQIGRPCKTCIDTCSFKIKTYSLEKDQDKKENNNNERTIEKSKTAIKCDFDNEWRKYLPVNNDYGV